MSIRPYIVGRARWEAGIIRESENIDWTGVTCIARTEEHATAVFARAGFDIKLIVVRKIPRGAQ